MNAYSPNHHMINAETQEIDHFVNPNKREWLYLVQEYTFSRIKILAHEY